MLVALATVNKDNAIGKIINAVKTSDSFVQNIKNLNKTSSGDLKLTYAYLAGLKDNDNKLLSLKVEGLKIMILHHLKLVMPQKCTDCSDIFYPLPGEKIEIGCIRCKRSACHKCYDMNPEVLKTLKYVCKPCIEDLDKEQGFQSLREEHFLKKGKRDNNDVFDHEEEFEDISDEEEAEKTKESEEPDLNNDKTFTNEYLKVNGGNTGKKTNENIRDKQIKDERTCKHLKRGRCMYGLSGNKPDENERTCGYTHPRTCNKLLNYGYKGSKGCNGKECKWFHPKICSGSLTGECDVKDCPKGYHIRYPFKRKEENREVKEKNDNVEENKKNEEEKEKEIPKKPDNTESKKEDNNSNLAFLDIILKQMQESQRQQQAQQEKFMMMFLEKIQHPPERNHYRPY